MALKSNLLANAIGQGWTALMGLAFIPVFIRQLGIDGYGLIGIFTVLQAWLTLLDLGLGVAVNREMARFTAGAHSASRVRTLLRSVELVCALLGLAVAVLLAASADWLSLHWVQSGGLRPAEIADALRLMGLVVGCRLLEGIYQGALLGLQRQVSFSAAWAAIATARWGGAASVLLLFDPTVRLFFLWQAGVSVAALVLLGVLLYAALPRGTSRERTRIDPRAAAALTRFGSGVVATTLLALPLTQLDKLLLSQLVSLEAFGYYTLAFVVGGAIQQLVQPMAQAYYPRLTQLLAAGDQAGLAQAYHTAAQLVSAVAVPVALMLIAFGDAALLLWTGDVQLASATAPLLSWVALGYLLNAFMTMPFCLQLAHGWSEFSAKVNLVAVVCCVPAMLWVAPRHGAAGLAWIWVALNIGYVVISVPLMHRRLLHGQKWRWYTRDLFAPMAAAAAVILLAGLVPLPAGAPARVAWLLGWGLGAMAASVVASGWLRLELRAALGRPQPHTTSG